MIVFQKNLKKGTIVRIKNILNDKTVLAKVGSRSEYPIFNNVVVTERISNEIDLDLDGDIDILLKSYLSNQIHINNKKNTH